MIADAKEPLLNAGPRGWPEQMLGPGHFADVPKTTVTKITPLDYITAGQAIAVKLRDLR
jgi:hypothetical protein